MHSLRLSLPALLFVVGVVAIAACAAAAAESRYDPLQTFAPLTFPQAVNQYRSASGAPGPQYWQNRADYEIHAQIDTSAKQLSASEVITYTNHSPDALASLWLQIDQNTYRRDARSTAADLKRPMQFTQGMILDEVAIESRGRTRKVEFLVSDTRLQIRLPEPLEPHGGKIRVRIRYHYAIPGAFGGRTSWVSTPHGDIYDIAQWYPRMAVYDDIRGWDTPPYLIQEFYLEYGDFDYSITVPADMIVAGSGELQNPREVLTPAEQQRLESARTSDASVMIRSAAEVEARGPHRDGTLTWHFRMQNTRDVAFSASPAFIWDAARIRLPGGMHSLAMSFYPPESAGAAAWGRSTEYLKHAVEEFSRRWFPYPYPAAINVAGGSSGTAVRWYPGQGQAAVLDHRARDRPYLVSHDRGLR
jgi:hypothetical protein